MNKQQLASKIWESANKMRSKIEANEYKDYILGFIFYKYLSDTEVKWLKENDFTDEDIKSLNGDDEEVLSYIQKNIGYFIAYKDLYSTWLKLGKDFDVSNVTDALSAFNRNISRSHKKVFEKIFNTLDTGLSKLGDSSNARTKAISDLLQLIKDIPTDGKQGYDVLGFIYEYLIGKFASNAGKKAGEFYTPHEVSLLMSEIVANHLRNKKEIKIYDPTSGSGSLLINIGRSISKYIGDSNNIKYYAQELKENTYNLTRMNLVMRGIKPDNIVTRNGDTLDDDWPYFDESDPARTYEPLYVEAVVSNPPYSQAWDTAGKENDARFSQYGLAPKGKADYAFLLHDLFHLKPDGIMTIVLPHGVLFRGGEEGTIRKNLIEHNNIDAIIGLPANIFYGTGIPTIIMVLKKVRENSDVLIIDASKGFIKDGKNNKLRSSDIKRITDTVIKRENVDKYARVVTREEIRENDYNLNIPRYVDSSEKAESWDIYASMFGGIPQKELDELDSYWKAFPNLRSDLFIDSSIPYVHFKDVDLRSMVENHSDVINYKNGFKNQFEGFKGYLENSLIEQVETVDINKEESIIANDVFNRLANVALIDKYEAYQILDDEWSMIATDLEIIQTEGFEACKKVDPNLVLKEKGDKEIEIQDGWNGRVIPFSLIKETILSDFNNSLIDMQRKLDDIPNRLSEIADEMSEEEKDGSFFEEETFVKKEVSKKLKELKKDSSLEAISLKTKLEKVEAIFNEEKTLKTQIKADSLKIEMLCKETIENLSDDKVKELLSIKWTDKLTKEINSLPVTIIKNLLGKLESLNKKYETTYFDIEKEIRATEDKLCAMIDDLEGDEYDMKGLEEFKKLLKGETL